VLRTSRAGNAKARLFKRRRRALPVEAPPPSSLANAE
jgi:hypothetical protein